MEYQVTTSQAFTVSDMEKMAIAVAKSGLFGMKKPEEALALMLVAQAEGRHPASVAMDYDVIQGKPALKSQAALRRFQESGGRVKWIVRTDKEVAATFTHPQAESVDIVWTMDRAKSMGYEKKSNWISQPMVMLTWRVVAEGVRLCYPACLSGAYLDTEVQDFSKTTVEAAATVTDIKEDEKGPIVEEQAKVREPIDKPKITQKQKEFNELKILVKASNKNIQDTAHDILEKYLSSVNKSFVELNEVDYSVLVDCLRGLFGERKAA
jgi:hypothetical protein